MKPNKCWMCGKIRELTEHHIVPKILRRLVPEINNHTVDVCWSCHNKIHIVLPKFFSDGSYRWNGSKKENTIFPDWVESKKDRILCE